MIIQKYFQVRITIPNPIDFCSDVDVNLKQQLISSYKNICYNNCYILEIGDIYNRSDCISNGDTCYMDVNFEAKVIVYNKGDIITGCRIMQRKQEFMLCTTERENIYVDNNQLINALQEKLIIPIVVQEVSYQPYANKINIMGSVFMLEKSYASYRVINLNNDVAIDDLQERINEQQTLLSQHDPKIKKVMIETCRGWGPTITPEGTEIKLANLSSLAINDIVGRDTRSDLTVASCYKQDSEAYTELSLGDVIYQLHTEYYKWLCFINEMCKLYNTEDELKRHRVYWTILASCKRAS